MMTVGQLKQILEGVPDSFPILIDGNWYGAHYGDSILVMGAGKYDGTWVVEDTMSPRHAGLDKIDFLVPADVRLGKWDNVEVYIQKRH